MKEARVYAITHDPTGAKYVGSTHNTVFSRIRQHMADLESGKHSSKRLQKLWNDSTICDWSFKVLEILPCGYHRSRLLAEKAWLDKLSPELRLNDNDRLQSYDKYSEVLRRVKRGEKYKQIAEAVGLSIGMISQIVRKHKDGELPV